MGKYLYYAIFKTVERNGENYILIDFPDFEGNAFTDAKTMEEALNNAKEVLTVNLLTMEDLKEDIPTPSSPKELKEKHAISEDDIIVPIKANTEISRMKRENTFCEKKCYHSKIS